MIPEENNLTKNIVKEKPKVSFVIPALNEEREISDTISTISKLNFIDCDIIVVDNGSTDKTRSLSMRSGAKVILAPDVSIAELRNIGARNSLYSVIVFLDADVCISESWEAAFLNTYKKLTENPCIITGNRCLPENDTKPLNKYWFSRLSQNIHKSFYINSGHMITTKLALEALGGFNSSLSTSEDYDLCARAKSSGIEVFNDERLIAIHKGYPKNILEFIIRELWHGSEDFKSLTKINNSRVAKVAILNGLTLMTSLILSTLNRTLYYLEFYMIFAMALSLAISTVKFGATPIRKNIASSFFAYIYISSRTLSPLLKIGRHRN
ncbi:hypothetical protein B9Q17_03735 [Marinobacter vinifirmus]|uniref:Glycosyltransferase 2-like domain-containing protein n=1 Tax=Marinobacter vinifirmus TaxID=355591 RepID=A0A7Z1IN65_9GAMM|nr:glycosyltransferase [Marinobacter vinifirmus]OZC37241.1 hypothetical protein B9Q17_03735 [Marinobacter vinifirmus]